MVKIRKSTPKRVDFLTILCVFMHIDPRLCIKMPFCAPYWNNIEPINDYIEAYLWTTGLLEEKPKWFEKFIDLSLWDAIFCKLIYLLIIDRMLNFFRNRKKNKDLLQNWHVPVDETYRRINNPDSVQYVNRDESRILYFSPIAITGNQLFSTETFAKMGVSVLGTENGWQLKGAKHTDKEVLVCLFSYTDESDEPWMKNLFDSIKAK